MTTKLAPPNFQETDQNLAELADQVETWQGDLAGGDKEKPIGAAALHRLKATRVWFGNPRDNLVALTPALFKHLEVELNPILRKQMQDERDFYYLTVMVNLAPQPGTLFSLLACQLDFGPKGPAEPIVQAIFPESQWRTVLRWGGKMSLDLQGDLNWGIGVDAAGLAEILKLPGLPEELKARILNKNKIKSFVAIPEYAYDVGRFDLLALGQGGSECYWRIQEPEVQKLPQVQLGVVFKVPKGTRSVQLNGVVWAEPKPNWLFDHVRNVASDLSTRLQALLRGDVAEVARNFARGSEEKWTLALPG